MSAALELLQQFEAIGARIEARDGRLLLHSEQPIPPPMIAAAKLAKSELIAAVSAKVAQLATPIQRPPRETVSTCTSFLPPEPLLMRDGRTLWRFRAQSIPEILNDEDIRPAVEARWCGCTLVADGMDLITVAPWGSALSDHIRNGLATNAGTIIAVLRGESRVRTGYAAK